MSFDGESFGFEQGAVRLLTGEVFRPAIHAVRRWVIQLPALPAITMPGNRALGAEPPEDSPPDSSGTAAMDHHILYEAGNGRFVHIVRHVSSPGDGAVEESCCGWIASEREAREFLLDNHFDLPDCLKTGPADFPDALPPSADEANAGKPASNWLCAQGYSASQVGAMTPARVIALMKKASLAADQKLSREVVETVKQLAGERDEAREKAQSTAGKESQEALSPRNRALGLVREHPDWTYQQIADEVGVHVRTVKRWDEIKRLKQSNRAYPSPRRGYKTDNGDIEMDGGG